MLMLQQHPQRLLLQLWSSMKTLVQDAQWDLKPTRVQAAQTHSSSTSPGGGWLLRPLAWFSHSWLSLGGSEDPTGRKQGNYNKDSSNGFIYFRVWKWFHSSVQKQSLKHNGNHKSVLKTWSQQQLVMSWFGKHRVAFNHIQNQCGVVVSVALESGRARAFFVSAGTLWN